MFQPQLQIMTLMFLLGVSTCCTSIPSPSFSEMTCIFSSPFFRIQLRDHVYSPLPLAARIMIPHSPGESHIVISHKKITQNDNPAFDLMEKGWQQFRYPFSRCPAKGVPELLHLNKSLRFVSSLLTCRIKSIYYE